MSRVPTSVTTEPAPLVVPDVCPDLASGFPSAEMVSSAAALFGARYRVPERQGSVPDVFGQGRASREKALELGHRDPWPLRTRVAARELVEGPRFRLVISPGSIAVRSSDPARAERAAERAQAEARGRVDLLRVELNRRGPVCAECSHDSCVRRRGYTPDRTPGEGLVTAWSARSRSRMVERLAQLDYAPFFDGGGVPAMLTTTYPGDWLAVAPDSATCHGHLRAFAMRYKRAWGAPLVAVWKREFQRRGAPHYHLLAVPPTGRSKDGRLFRQWFSETWADVVGSEWCGECVPGRSVDGVAPVCCERSRHVLAGTGIDYAEGLRARDPKRLGVYFSKHGAYSAKDYQNHAPEEWGNGSVGRFWGYWGLSPATADVPVTQETALAAARLLRAYSNANTYTVRVPVWRKRYQLDRATGEVTGWRWVKRHSTVPVRRMRGHAGYLVVNDGPSLAATASRFLTAEPRPVRPSGAGPVGFLP